jgi:outer membrane lipoprotein-sorting protein
MKKLIITTIFLLQAGLAMAAPRQEVNQPADIPTFMANLGKKASDFKTLKTDFTQEKRMAMFKQKMVMKGRIYLQKPNKIAWHVDAPMRYSVLITDKLIRQWDEDTNKVQEISLAKNPIFQNVLNQMNVWFSGDYGSMLDTNTVRIVKSEPLVIEFVPKENNIARKVIKTITVTFRSDQKYLQQIRILEQSGDVTTISFGNTQLNPTLTNGNFEVKGRV